MLFSWPFLVQIFKLQKHSSEEQLDLGWRSRCISGPFPSDCQIFPRLSPHIALEFAVQIVRRWKGSVDTHMWPHKSVHRHRRGPEGVDWRKHENYDVSLWEIWPVPVLMPAQVQPQREEGLRKAGMGMVLVGMVVDASCLFRYSLCSLKILSILSSFLSSFSLFCLLFSHAFAFFLPESPYSVFY